MTDKQLQKQQAILANVENVIVQGPYTDTWESLCQFEAPQWYRDAKFGIFIHWGVFSVPAFANEWYSRNMYHKGTPENEHHVETYGPLTSFGYKDFIPMFKGEKFSAEEWAALFEAAGAKYMVPVAEHHDGFQMYQSELSDWNAANMGPKRDVLGELKSAAQNHGLEFCTSNHRAEHCWFFNGGMETESDVPANPDFYDVPVRYENTERNMHDLYYPVPPQGHLDNWLARLCELVDRYRPHIVYFDWWIQQEKFRPYLRKFAAYYYNRAAQWGEQVAINYKYAAFMQGSAIFDVERGQLEAILPDPWQTDTSINKNSWCHVEQSDFKDSVSLIGDLVDIVSKNGCMLLNVGPKSDGTITREERDILLAMGRWLKVNGEGIYGSRPWVRFGEGPTQIKSGAFTDTNRTPFTSRDIRYTRKPGRVYAYCMRTPEDGVVRLTALARNYSHSSDYLVGKVSLLGGGEVPFERDETCMTVRLSPAPGGEYPVGLRIDID
jgi:alpha-L-fucosidase